MRFRHLISAAVLFVLAASPLPPPASAAGSGSLRVEVLVGGVPLREYRSAGNLYVEARRGREYSLRLTNLEPVRVAVAVSVDGRNTIDARRTTARAARKWIIDPYQSIVLDGWQSGEDTANRFVFTSEARSYAAWLGDASQSGVIEAVAYRERFPEAEQISEGWGLPGSAPSEASPIGRARDGASSSRNEPNAEAAAPQAGARAQAKAEGQKRDDDLAATGFGRDVRHEVVRVEFDSEPVPCATVRVRYEYRDALVRLGVLEPTPPRPDPLTRRESARGFSGPYCPVPPGR